MLLGIWVICGLAFILCFGLFMSMVYNVIKEDDLVGKEAIISCYSQGGSVT